MKMSLKNRKNALDYLNKKNYEKNNENKENIYNNNCINSNGLFNGIKKEKEINMMNID